MQQYLQNKKGLVESVFDQVYDRYDLMNDFMSLGVHRLWKKQAVKLMKRTKEKQESTLLNLAHTQRAVELFVSSESEPKSEL